MLRTKQNNKKLDNYVSIIVNTFNWNYSERSRVEISTHLATTNKSSVASNKIITIYHHYAHHTLMLHRRHFVTNISALSRGDLFYPKVWLLPSIASLFVVVKWAHM